MKKLMSIALCLVMLLSILSVSCASAAQQNASSVASSLSFKTYEALYAHAVLDSDDTEAWQAWQSEHDEEFNSVNPDVMYFFLPTSADSTKVEIYNAFDSKVTVNDVEIASGKTATVSYNTNTDYPVRANGKNYTLRFMKSNAEAAIYINNSDADGYGTELMKYLNEDKSRSAKATGVIVDANGNIDNTEIKKIKGRGNTTWDKPKKAYNITYDEKVSIAGMAKSKKFSILANYQDDSLSRNRFLYDLADAVDMPYASDSRYVDFYANGFYWGSYQMTEKIEAGSSSLIYDVDEEDYLNTDGTIKENFSFVCEVDASAKDGEDYYFKSSSGSKITIKVPELEEGDKGYNEVKDYVKTKYDAFYTATRSRTADLSKHAEVESLAKLYFINELGKNWDSGVSSTFFVYKPDSDGSYKFFGSPVWDYDNSLGNATGVDRELGYMGVADYEEYSGWWCKYKGKKSTDKTSTNIMNCIARNTKVLEVAPKVWFEEFVPAIDHFAGKKTSTAINKEMYTSDNYYSLIKGSAEMNYKSGWLLNTGDWIADHTSLKKATFDLATKTYTVDTNTTKYANNFEGMYNYTRDWMVSRAAWLSNEMKNKYTPTMYEMGDVDLDGRVTVVDSTVIQKYVVGMTTLNDTQKSVADVNGDTRINVVDATDIQKSLVGFQS